jgi:Domain of Unknown Function (DUF1080)
MNLIHTVTLAMALSLTPVLPAAEFGAVPDPYTGNWSGTLKSKAKEEPVHATVIAYKNRYEITLRAEPDTRKPAIVVFNGTIQMDKLVLEQALNQNPSETNAVRQTGNEIKTAHWNGQAKGNELTGTFAGGETGTFSLRKIPFQPSPTLGDKGPAGALVLFDGKHLNAWESKQASADAIQWIVAESGALEVVSQRDGKKNKQDLRTKENFGDYRLHAEFKLTYKPEATGQGRSNSGIIHLGIYETQILDSFGLYGRDNECGAIYKLREPDRNAGYPAGLWQTYDIEFKAPRFTTEGNKTADARMSVRLNGILIHNDVAVPNPTGGGVEVARGPIVLQDHGNPVQFRNIWAVKAN